MSKIPPALIQAIEDAWQESLVELQNESVKKSKDQLEKAKLVLRDKSVKIAQLEVALKASANEADREISNAKQHAQGLTQALQNKQQSISEMQATIETQIQQIQDLKEKVKSEQGESLEKESDKTAQLERLLKEKTQHVVELQNNIESIANDNELLHNENKKQANKIDTYEIQITELLEQVATLRDDKKYRALKDEYETLEKLYQEETKSLRDTLNEQETEHSSVVLALQEAEMQLTEIKKSADTAKEEALHLQASLSSTLSENETLHNTINTQKQNESALLESIESLNKQLAEQLAINADSSEKQALISELDNRGALLASLQIETRRLAERLQRRENEHEALHRGNLMLQSRNSSLTEKYESVSAQLKQKESAALDHKNHIQILERQLRLSEKKIEHLEGVVAEKQ